MVVLLTEGHLNLPMYMCLAKHQGHFFVAHTRPGFKGLWLTCVVCTETIYGKALRTALQ